MERDRYLSILTRAEECDRHGWPDPRWHAEDCDGGCQAERGLIGTPAKETK